MSRQFNIAILGATGAVGKQLIESLAERNFPVNTLFPLASQRSVGKTVDFLGKTIDVIDVETFNWEQVEIALFSAGGKVSRLYAPIAAEAGCVVIDNTSEFRYEADIPLIIPEVNIEQLVDYRHHNIIANPNCSTIQMLVALKPIYDAVGINRIQVATYQSVSGAGESAISELITQIGDLLNGKPVQTNVFPKQIAFNAIPQIDHFMENGYTKEEMKMVWETQKILNDYDIEVNATAVRIPVVCGHSEAITIETQQPISLEEIQTLLSEGAGITLFNEQANYPTAFEHAVNNDQVLVGRVRQDLFRENTFNLWVVADNLRKGAATNSIQIAERLIADHL